MQQYGASKKRYDGASKCNNINPQTAMIQSQKRLKSADTNLAIVTIILDLIDVYNNVDISYQKTCRLILDNSTMQTL